ncbi:hypothetical protein FOL47_005623 [Perkinsus chesapeaki]|uniref:Uncharacterized protein n=1 Tax=Perkinsus chesapeaki TaxID=330153 RepID=A0A7J6MYG2_PERCH|nr:hypothetical protein FOL47_005623 [Perkinsus chesapeaki]
MPSSDSKANVQPKDLFKWISKQTHSATVDGFADLQDGEILLEMVQQVWPDLSPLGTTCDAWEGISRIANAADVPSDLLDAAARWSTVERAALNDKAFAAAMYNTLAALYFLWNLCQSHDFSADFELPIDARVAKFLQSDASVQSLLKGGGLSVETARESAVSDREEKEAGPPIRERADGSSLHRHQPALQPSEGKRETATSEEKQSPARHSTNGKHAKEQHPQPEEHSRKAVEPTQRAMKSDAARVEPAVAKSVEGSSFQWASGADAAERGEAIIHRLRSEVKRLHRQLDMDKEAYRAMEDLTQRKLLEQELRFAHEKELLKESHSAALWEAESGLADDAVLRAKVMKEQAGGFRDRSPTVAEYAAVEEAMARMEMAMRKQNERVRASEDERLQLGDRVLSAASRRPSTTAEDIQDLYEAAVSSLDRRQQGKALPPSDRELMLNLEKLMNRIDEERLILERQSRDAEALRQTLELSDQVSEMSASGAGASSPFAGDSSTVASVCGDAEAMERTFRIEKECEELRATTSYLRQRLKLLEGSETATDHTREDEAQLVALLRRLRAHGFESSRKLSVLFWKLVGSSIRAHKEAEAAVAATKALRDRLKQSETARTELAHKHADEIDSLKKRHRRELKKLNEEMTANSCEAELRREIAEMAVSGRDAEIARLRAEMSRQWKRCWATDTERFESLWDDLQGLRAQNDILTIRDRQWKELVKEVSSNQKNEHRVKQLWAKLNAANLRISDSPGIAEQKALLQKAVEDRLRVYEARIADLEREQLRDELNPQAVAELQERVVEVESRKTQLARENAALQRDLTEAKEMYNQVQQELHRDTKTAREALDAVTREKDRLKTELDIYTEQLTTNEALKELLSMAAINAIDT